MNGRDDMQSSGTRRQPPMDAKSRLREFVETAKRMKTERATAEEVVRQLLRNTPVAEWPQLADREELRNSGALERLGCESRDLLERKPQEALAIAELATTIADSLPEDTYPAAVLAQVRAGAWKDRANALRYVSRHDEAYDAISRAEKTLNGHPALVVDRAVVDLVKAMVVHDLGEREIAQELLRHSEEVFAETGEHARLSATQLIAANHLYEDGRYADARLKYENLLRTTTTECAARLHNNLGFCDTHLGSFASANIHFSEAIARFTDLGFTAEATRTRRGAGLLLVEKGQTTTGLQHLHEAHESFVEFGMIREAALTGLEIAEVLLKSGDSEGAQELCARVASDSSPKLSAHARGVLAGLATALADDNASVESIREVHTFIAELDDRMFQDRAAS